MEKIKSVMDFVMANKADLLIYGSVLVNVVLFIKAHGWKKCLKAVVSGVDVALADKAMPREVGGVVRSVIQTVAGVAGKGTEKKLGRFVNKIRSVRMKKNKKLGGALKLDEKGRPSGEINFGIDF